MGSHADSTLKRQPARLSWIPGHGLYTIEEVIHTSRLVHSYDDEPSSCLRSRLPFHGRLRCCNSTQAAWDITNPNRKWFVSCELHPPSVRRAIVPNTPEGEQLAHTSSHKMAAWDQMNALNLVLIGRRFQRVEDFIIQRQHGSDGYKLYWISAPAGSYIYLGKPPGLEERAVSFPLL